MRTVNGYYNYIGKGSNVALGGIVQVLGLRLQEFEANLAVAEDFYSEDNSLDVTCNSRAGGWRCAPNDLSE